MGRIGFIFLEVAWKMFQMFLRICCQSSKSVQHKGENIRLILGCFPAGKCILGSENTHKSHVDNESRLHGHDMSWEKTQNATCFR